MSRVWTEAGRALQEAIATDNACVEWSSRRFGDAIAAIETEAAARAEARVRDIIEAWDNGWKTTDESGSFIAAIERARAALTPPTANEVPLTADLALPTDHG